MLTDPLLNEDASTTIKKPQPGKSDLFRKHFRKVKNNTQQGSKMQYKVHCNYCTTKHQFTTGGGYGTFHRHLVTKHPIEYGISPNQTQLSTGGAGTYAIFKYTELDARRETSKFVAVNSLPFSVCR